MSFQAADFAILSMSIGERLLLRGVMPGAADHRAPVGEHEIDALLLEGRHIDAGQPLRRGHADGAQLAGLDLPFVLALAGDAGGDLAAENGGERLAAARERHIVDLRRRRRRPRPRTTPP